MVISLTGPTSSLNSATLQATLSTDATAGASLSDLAGSVGTPFPWRRQMPLFRFSVVVFTFVLEGDHEGEIWRYEIGPDHWDTVRAAPSLAAGNGPRGSNTITNSLV